LGVIIKNVSSISMTQKMTREVAEMSEANREPFLMKFFLFFHPE